MVIFSGFSLRGNDDAGSGNGCSGSAKEKLAGYLNDISGTFNSAAPSSRRQGL